MARHNPAKHGAAVKHMGFKAAEASAAAGGARDPGAVIGAAAQHASAAAKARNPRLNLVGGVGKNKAAGKY
jgi:hypothetical protein